MSPQHTSKGAIELDNCYSCLCAPVSFGLLALFANNHICVPWEPTVRTVAQPDSALCPDWTPARSCQKPALEGTYPSWSASEMWHEQVAMTANNKACVGCAVSKSAPARSDSMQSLHDCLGHATRWRQAGVRRRLKEAGLHDIRLRTALLGAQCSAVKHETHT